MEFAIAGDYLYAGLIGREFERDGSFREELILVSLEIKDSSTPHLLDIWIPENIDKNVRNSREIRIAGQHAFLGLHSGLVVVDLSDPRQLRELTRVELEDLKSPDQVRGLLGKRPITVQGERAYVGRLWPRETVALDISDPSRPIEVGHFYRPRFPWVMEIWDGHIYQKGPQYISQEGSFRERRIIRVYELSDSDWLERLQTLRLPDESPANGGDFADIIVSGGYVHTLLENSLVIFPAAGRPEEQ